MGTQHQAQTAHTLRRNRTLIGAAVFALIFVAGVATLIWQRQSSAPTSGPPPTINADEGRLSAGPTLDPPPVSDGKGGYTLPTAPSATTPDPDVYGPAYPGPNPFSVQRSTTTTTYRSPTDPADFGVRMRIVDDPLPTTVVFPKDWTQQSEVHRYANGAVEWRLGRSDTTFADAVAGVKEVFNANGWSVIYEGTKSTFKTSDNTRVDLQTIYVSSPDLRGLVTLSKERSSAALSMQVMLGPR
jgi:hypothetical protein